MKTNKSFDNMEDFLDDLFTPPKTLMERVNIFFRRLNSNIRGICKSVVYAWQRISRGWDDSVVYDIGYHLEEMMPIWLRELKKRAVGVPFRYFPPDLLLGEEEDDDFELARQKWHSDIDIVIAGFEANKKRDDTDFEWNTVDDLHSKETGFEATFEIGMKKLIDIWDTLWW